MSTEARTSAAPAKSPAFRWDAADAYLFDVDSTLLYARDGIHYKAFVNAVQQFFSVPPRTEGVPLHGNTDLGIIRAVLRREGVSDAEIDAKLPLMTAAMCAEVERNAARMSPELCPSVEEVVKRLAAAGKLLGLATGNLETIAWKKLEACGLRPYFAFGSFSDHREQRADVVRWGVDEARRRLWPEASVYVVGDTPADIQAARAAGVPVIAVATGIFGLEELQSHGPDLCVRCCTDLLAVSQCHV
ncbi:MAG TPA: HAD family hydrolase [Terriglobales bacterium]|nr:HAD family hydrolase [Terriglobales bacterium]